METKGLLEGRKAVCTVSLPIPLLTATRQAAKREERPFSWLVRSALVRYLTDRVPGDQVVDEGGDHER